MVSYAHMTCKAHAHSTYIGLVLLVAKPNVSLCIESITRVNFLLNKMVDSLLHNNSNEITRV